MSDPFSCVDDGVIRNGDFLTDDFWTINAQWQILSNQISIAWVIPVANMSFQQSIPLVIGQTYRVSLEITEWTADPFTTIKVRLGGVGGNESANISGVGVHEAEIVYNGFGEYIFIYVFQIGVGAHSLSVDNISFSSSRSYVGCALGMFKVPDPQVFDLVLGGGDHNYHYKSDFDSSAVWIAFEGS